MVAANPVSADEPAQSAPGAWVEMGAPPPDSEVRTFQGERGPAGGCDFDIEITLAPDEDVVRADEVGRNLATCEVKVAVRKNEAVPAPTGKQAGVTETKRETTAPAGQVGIQAYTHSVGYMRTWWTDPPGAVVNWVENGVRWYWDGNCALGESWWQYLGWLQATGWRKLSEDYDTWANCTESVSSSKVRYRNQIFCAFIDTYADYDRNTVRGRWNGWLVGETNSWVSGGCSSWLTRHWELKRTKN